MGSWFTKLPKYVVLVALPWSKRPRCVLFSPLTSLPTVCPVCPGWGHSTGMRLPGRSPESGLQRAESTRLPALQTAPARSDPACLSLPRATRLLRVGSVDHIR